MEGRDGNAFRVLNKEREGKKEINTTERQPHELKQRRLHLIPLEQQRRWPCYLSPGIKTMRVSISFQQKQFEPEKRDGQRPTCWMWLGT